VEKVAKHLGNTPTICRRCYIHPAVLDGYLDGTMLGALAENTRKYLAENVDGMSAEEAAVTAFLRLRLDELAEQDQNRSPAKQQRQEARLPEPA
jgi:DNA topoisomerase-1